MGHRFTREPSIISSDTAQEVDWALWRGTPDALGDGGEPLNGPEPWGAGALGVSLGG